MMIGDHDEFMMTDCSTTTLFERVLRVGAPGRAAARGVLPW